MHVTSMTLKVVAVVGALVFVGRSSDGGEVTVAQTTCPVMGGKIKKSVYADHGGKRVYFCCPMCIGKFKADPEKHILKLEGQGVTFEKTPMSQTRCPVMGGKINKRVYADHDGKRVYFCCPGCDRTFKKAPERYILKLERQGVTFEKTPMPQTRCPVMGGKIKKSVYADHGGKRVYFCCPMCIGKFKADPEKYIRKLEGQGVTFEKKPMPQTRCPVMGGKINKRVYADHDGKRVYFCCPGCDRAFKKDPAKYIKKLEAAGVTVAKVPGT